MMLRRRTMMASGNGGWEEVLLNYTDGDTFTLMGQTFSYNAQKKFYSAASAIYPSAIEFTLGGAGTITGANSVLFGGGNTTQNEAWFSSYGAVLNVRFDNQVVRGIRDAHGVYIGVVDGATLLLKSDGSIFYNGERAQSDFLGTMKFISFNGRDGGVTSAFKISKIRLKP